ncbi:hypothetical protein GCM10018771_25960 [Streptomyces cellulosae]|nr:hypothetical protein GCM10018771_25960 [Streptomyces cellulosae]
MTTDTTTKDTAAGAPAPGSVVLDARGVTMRFGGLTAVRDVDLTVRSVSAYKRTCTTSYG